jgi:hypothetical protein
MKPILSLTLGVVALAFAGCNNNQPTGADTPGAAQSVDNHLIQDREDFIVSANQKMKDLDSGIRELSAKAESYTGDAKIQADQTLAALREQRAVLGTKYDALKQSTETGWMNARTGFQGACDDLQRAYEDAKSKFS